MGRGIALQFKRNWPANFEFYVTACSRNEVVPGKMCVFETGNLHNPRFIINFPTKRHWKAKSRIEDIDAGLIDLVRVIDAPLPIYDWKGILGVVTPILVTTQFGQ